MQTLKVRAKHRNDYSKDADVAWAHSFMRSGILFPDRGSVEVEIVEGQPSPSDNEVSRDGAKRIVGERKLMVVDSELVRELRKELQSEATEKREVFIGAEVCNEYFDPIVDVNIDGQTPTYNDGYEYMTKKELAGLCDEQGLDSKELSRAGKLAMISALRGH